MACIRRGRAYAKRHWQGAWKAGKNLQSLDHNIDHIDHKIHNQTKIMRNIRKK
eukprot:TRINITY_DN3737_c0_g1_i1.p1 TRINITY_DN3737_c0_g1~~TRINITY_DN3737_c0_g1_i1.p1  ORF type:complete len:53 (+),score=8.25 TRINITY_DN3737_c0_g1_i1:36-194(+)